jgi:hypothetical protein
VYNFLNYRGNKLFSTTDLVDKNKIYMEKVLTLKCTYKNIKEYFQIGLTCNTDRNGLYLLHRYRNIEHNSLKIIYF